MARWAGWGAVPQLFDEHLDDFAEQRAELKQLLTEQQYRAAARSTINAHYTDAALVKVIWEGLAQLGFTGGTVLEPGCGSGHFIGLAPDDARMVGVEREPISAAIAAALYPHADIHTASFADITAAEGSFDAAIGNVPFANITLHDPRHNSGKHSLHNHFIIKSLHLTRPGGMVAVLTSRYTMDARNPAARREMAQLADLVSAIRLPSGAHRRAAGTEVVTDLLILRRREPDRAPAEAAGWERVERTPLGDDGTTVEINRYFLDHPDHVLGELSLGRGRFGAEDLVVRGEITDLSERLATVLERVAADAVGRGLGMTPPPETPVESRPATTVSVVDPEAARFEGFLAARPDGSFTRRVGGTDQPYTPPAKQAEELRALLGLRDTAMALIKAEQATVDDTSEITGLRAELNRRYEAYREQYGAINRYTVRRQARQGWHVFRQWCEQHGYESMPADPAALRAYMQHLLRAGIGQDILSRHLDSITKAHTRAFDREVAKAATQLARHDSDPAEARRQLLEEHPPLDLLRRAHLPDLRMPEDAIRAAEEIIAQAPQKTSNLVDLDELGLRNEIINRPPQGGFGDDPFANYVRALEKFDPSTQTARKADILLRRVINPTPQRLGAETAEEALSICLDTHSRVDLAVIAQLLGLPGPQEARAALGELVYDDPDLGEPVWAPLYLSGNVRQKLARAELAAADNPAFEVNVAALRRVVPKDLGPEDIEVRLGSWIGPEYVQAFLRDILGDHSVTVESVAGMWAIDNKDRRKSVRVAATEIWGAGGLDAYELTEKLLVGTPIQVKKTIEVDGVEREVLDVEATENAQDKAVEIGNRFADWIWEDTSRAASVMRRYNELFNAEIPADFSGVELSLPGLSQAYELRPHQKEAVARIIYQPATGLVHDVGAGKTLEIIVGMMERRRRGLATKPMVVVPNDSIAEQFERQWLQAYPNARLLTAGSAELADDKKKGRNGRAEFVARVATGDWDAVILTKEAFQRIPLPEDAQEDFLRAELDALEAEKRSHIDVLGPSMTKRLESAMEAAEQRLKSRLADIERDVAGMTLADAGVDYLVVDEAQNYKNGMVNSAIPDLVIEGAHRSIDLDMKLSWLQKKHGSARVVLATATPWTGKFSEVYLWLRRLGHDLPRFDAWARTFVTSASFMEMTPGGTLRPKTRTRGTINEPELWRQIRLTSDVKMQADLRLPIPPMRGGKVEVVTVPASPEARVLTLDLARREKNLSGPPKPGEDNHLVIAHDGQLAATDLRTVGVQTNAPQKVDVLADDIHHEWSLARDNVYLRDDGTEHPVRGGLILVFCDESTPSNSWNFYHELRAQLVARGMAEDTIRFIHEAGSPQRRADLLAACREGAVSVLVGSTAKMGAGLNVQDRVIGGYEVTPPWRPDISVQAIGRAGRQGNQNPEFFWKRLVLAPSLDAKKWEIASQKHTMFEPLYSSNEPARSRELATDDELGLADAMTAATGDPRYREKADLDRELKALKRQHSAYLRRQQALKLTISASRERIPKLEEKADRQDAVARRRVDTRGEQFRMTIRSTTYTSRTKAAEALVPLVEAAAKAVDRWSYEPEEVTLGQIGGFTLAARARSLPKPQILLYFADAPDSSTGVILDPDELPTGRGLITRIENQLDALATEGDRTREQIEEERRTITASHEALGQPFPGAARMEEVTRRRAELISQLSAGEEEAADPNEDPNSPEARARAARREARARELRELYDTARDLAQHQHGLSVRAAQTFASWYQTITSPVVADQRPPIDTALSVWTAIGRPDSGGRSRLRTLGAAEVQATTDEDVTHDPSQADTTADTAHRDADTPTVDPTPPPTTEPATRTTDAAIAESPLSAILAASDRIQLHHIGPTTRENSTRTQEKRRATPANDMPDRAPTGEASQTPHSDDSPAPESTDAVDTTALTKAGLNAEQARWLHRQAVALAHTVDIRNAMRTDPEAAQERIRTQLDRVMVGYRRSSADDVDPVGREVAIRYGNDRDVADRVRDWVVPAVHALTTRNLAAPPAQQVRDLLTDLDLPHTDADADWLTNWITGLTSHPELRLRAQANAEDQFAAIVPTEATNALADAMEGANPPPQSVIAMLIGRNLDAFVVSRWHDLIRSVVFDAVHERSTPTTPIADEVLTAAAPTVQPPETSPADLPTENSAEAPEQAPERTVELPPEPTAMLRRFRELGGKQGLQVSVVRVAEAVFVTLHEPATPQQPVLCWPAESTQAFDGAARPMALEAIEDYLQRYRSAVDPAWFTLDTRVRHWARRMAQLAPHIVPGARDDHDELAQLVQQAAQHATSDERHAEDLLRRAERETTPLRLAPSREAQVVRTIHDLAPGYAPAGDVGRYLTDPAHLDGTWQEWEWINNYTREHPEVLSGTTALNRIRKRDADEAAERDKAATALVKQASTAFRDKDFERALDLIDRAELLYPEGLARWERARHRVMAKAEQLEDSSSEPTSAETPPTDEISRSVVPAPEATAADAAPEVSDAEPKTAEEPMMSVLPADVQVALYAQINHEAARWFEAQLDSSPEAQRYLERRLGGPDKVRRVRLTVNITGGLCIGYAPDSWTGLVDHLRQQGFKEQDLVDAGVAAVSSRGTLIDRFRGRIMFGIRDHRGLLAGFTGRALSDSASAKYLNSPASVLFDKSKLLFGLYEQAPVAPHADAIVAVEGPFDVAATLANSPQRCPIVVVAPCGTALTSGHLDAIDALVPRDRPRVFAFDADASGRKAVIERATDALGRYDELGLTTLPDGQDPAEYALSVGPEENAAAYLGPPHTRPAVEVLVEARLQRWGDRVQWVDGQVDAARDVATLLAVLNPDRVSDLVVRLAERLQVDATYLAEFIADARHAQGLPPDRPLRLLDQGDTNMATAEAEQDQAPPEHLVEAFPEEESAQPNVAGERSEPEKQQEPGLVIEHGHPGTVVRGTDKNDLRLREILQECGFKWSRRQGIWYLPRSWKYDTRGWRVQELQRALDAAERPYTTAEPEKIKIGSVPPPPADAIPFESLLDLKGAQREVHVAFSHTWDTPAGRDLISSLTYGGYSEGSPEGRALHKAMAQAREYRGDDATELLKLYQPVYETAYVLHATLVAERKRAPKLMHWLEALVQRSQEFVARLTASSRQHDTAEAAPTRTAEHDETAQHTPVTGQDAAGSTAQDGTATGQSRGDTAGPDAAASTVDEPVPRTHEEHTQAPPAPQQPGLSAASALPSRERRKQTAPQPQGFPLVLPEGELTVERLRQWARTHRETLPEGVEGREAGPLRLALAVLDNALTTGAAFAAEVTARRIAGMHPAPLETADYLTQMADAISTRIPAEAATSLGRYHDDEGLADHLRSISTQLTTIAQDPVALRRARAAEFLNSLSGEAIEQARRAATTRPTDSTVAALFDRSQPPAALLDAAVVQTLRDAFVAHAQRSRFDALARGRVLVDAGAGEDVALALQALASEARARARVRDHTGQALRAAGIATIADQLDAVAGSLATTAGFTLPDEQGTSARPETPAATELPPPEPLTSDNYATTLRLLSADEVVHLVRRLGLRDPGSPSSPGTISGGSLPDAPGTTYFKRYLTTGLQMTFSSGESRREGRLSWKRLQSWIDAGLSAGIQRRLLAADTAANRFTSARSGFAMIGEAELASAAYKELDGYRRAAVAEAIDRATEFAQTNRGRPPRRRTASPNSADALWPADQADISPEDQAVLDRIHALMSVLPAEVIDHRKATDLVVGDVVEHPGYGFAAFRLTQPPIRHRDRYDLAGEFLDDYEPRALTWSCYFDPKITDAPFVRVVVRPESLVPLMSSPAAPTGPAAADKEVSEVDAFAVGAEFDVAAWGWSRTELTYGEHGPVERWGRDGTTLVLRWRAQGDDLLLEPTVTVDDVDHHLRSEEQLHQLLRETDRGDDRQDAERTAATRPAASHGTDRAAQADEPPSMGAPVSASPAGEQGSLFSSFEVISSAADAVASRPPAPRTNQDETTTSNTSTTENQDQVPEQTDDRAPQPAPIAPPSTGTPATPAAPTDGVELSASGRRAVAAIELVPAATRAWPVPEQLADMPIPRPVREYEPARLAFVHTQRAVREPGMPPAHRATIIVNLAGGQTSEAVEVAQHLHALAALIDASGQSDRLTDGSSLTQYLRDTRDAITRRLAGTPEAVSSVPPSPALASPVEAAQPGDDAVDPGVGQDDERHSAAPDTEPTPEVSSDVDDAAAALPVAGHDSPTPTPLVADVSLQDSATAVASASREAPDHDPDEALDEEDAELMSGLAEDEMGAPPQHADELAELADLWADVADSDSVEPTPATPPQTPDTAADTTAEAEAVSAGSEAAPAATPPTGDTTESAPSETTASEERLAEQWATLVERAADLGYAVQTRYATSPTLPPESQPTVFVDAELPAHERLVDLALQVVEIATTQARVQATPQPPLPGPRQTEQPLFARHTGHLDVTLAEPGDPARGQLSGTLDLPRDEELWPRVSGQLPLHEHAAATVVRPPAHTLATHTDAAAARLPGSPPSRRYTAAFGEQPRPGATRT